MLGTRNLGDILSEREAIASEMQEGLDEATDPWGVLVERVEVRVEGVERKLCWREYQTPSNCSQVKDVRVPENLQRAMAAEAEAARNARAKVDFIIIINIMIIFKIKNRFLKRQNEKGDRSRG